MKQLTKDNLDFTILISWRLQLDMPGKVPKFTEMCLVTMCKGVSHLTNNVELRANNVQTILSTNKFLAQH